MMPNALNHLLWANLLHTYAVDGREEREPVRKKKTCEATHIAVKGTIEVPNFGKTMPVE
jgi:hypothetical protein